MRSKWEISVIFSLIIFIIFIIYISFFFPNLKRELISENYYEEEIKYQDIINEKKNASKISKKIDIKTTNNGIEILFPSYYYNTHGIITLLRYSSKNLDFTRNFEIVKNKSNKKIFINKNFLKKGQYKIIIRWKHNKKKYFFEKELLWK
ncbi:FixH family protein [Blattabacterium cuenoti]|uniref:FixH family protein n=1 Tax=Blattabacterium cuenoti TaxID=1653831 RepID=UPI001EEC870E|nr:FixH family protein [Blattabacterium cuenoti]